MNNFVINNTNLVKGLNNQYEITAVFDLSKQYYEKGAGRKA